MSDNNQIGAGLSSLKVFTIGALIGAGIALLYAPRAGKETRKLLVKKGRQLQGKAEEALEDAKEFVKDKKTELAEALTTATDAVEDLKAKHRKAG